MKRILLLIGTMGGLFALTLIPRSTPTVEANPDNVPNLQTGINAGNFVWDDLDQDGKQDAGEPGIAGVQVLLWTAPRMI